MTFQFDGNQEDASKIAGSIILLRLFCDGSNGPIESCISFRIAGESGEQFIISLFFFANFIAYFIRLE